MSAIEYAETKQIKNIADSIISLANDYNSEINRLFNMFAAVPYDTKEWVGNQSDKFFDLVALEKADFISFGDRIREAVMIFQRWAGLVDDGIVGKLTWDKLYEVYRSVV